MKPFFASFVILCVWQVYFAAADPSTLPLVHIPAGAPKAIAELSGYVISSSLEVADTPDGQRLYFGARKGNNEYAVIRTRTDGGGGLELLFQPQVQVYALAVDPGVDSLFYIQYGNAGRQVSIMKRTLLGTYPATVHAFTLPNSVSFQPALTLDPVKKHLYWVECQLVNSQSKCNKITRATYSGTGVQTVLVIDTKDARGRDHTLQLNPNTIFSFDRGYLGYVVTVGSDAVIYRSDFQNEPAGVNAGQWGAPSTGKGSVACAAGIVHVAGETILFTPTLTNGTPLSSPLPLAGIPVYPISPSPQGPQLVVDRHGTLLYAHGGDLYRLFVPTLAPRCDDGDFLTWGDYINESGSCTGAPIPRHDEVTQYMTDLKTRNEKVESRVEDLENQVKDLVDSLKDSARGGSGDSNQFPWGWIIAGTCIGCLVLGIVNKRDSLRFSRQYTDISSRSEAQTPFGGGAEDDIAIDSAPSGSDDDGTPSVNVSRFVV